MSHNIINSLLAHRDSTCVLLVHPDVQVLHAHALEVSGLLGVKLLSVGKELSRTLLGEPSQAYPRLARAWLFATIARLAPDPIVLADIDLLFDPAWALDPLALFSSASRAARLVVAWPGAYVDGTLAYAVPAHSAYRTWQHPSVEIIALS